MDSELTTNRKGFIKRASLAIAAAFAVSSTTRTRSKGSVQAAQDTQPKAMARVRTAKGAVPRSAFKA